MEVNKNHQAAFERERLAASLDRERQTETPKKAAEETESQSQEKGAQQDSLQAEDIRIRISLLNCIPFFLKYQFLLSILRFAFVRHFELVAEYSRSWRYGGRFPSDKTTIHRWRWNAMDQMVEKYIAAEQAVSDQNDRDVLFARFLRTMHDDKRSEAICEFPRECGELSSARLPSACEDLLVAVKVLRERMPSVRLPVPGGVSWSKEDMSSARDDIRSRFLGPCCCGPCFSYLNLKDEACRALGAVQRNRTSFNLHFSTFPRRVYQRTMKSSNCCYPEKLTLTYSTVSGGGYRDTYTGANISGGYEAVRLYQGPDLDCIVRRLEQ